MYQNSRAEFESFMFDSQPHRLEEFWTEVQHRKDPRIENHPMTKRPNWKRFAVPLLLHGDDVPVVKVGKPGTVKLHNCSWQPLLSCGRTLYIKRLIVAIFKSSMTPNTETQVWHLIVWSLKWAFRGIHPDTDWDGNAWPDESSHKLVGDQQCKLAGQTE